MTPPTYPNEEHGREQYFFDPPTMELLADRVARYRNPCLLCAPMLGRELQRRGRIVRVLDTDRRFADLPGFAGYDLYRPAHVGERFDLILCDPPFFNVSLSQLFRAVRLLADFDLTARVMIAYPCRRAAAILSVFAPFNLRATGERPTYLTVQACERNEIEWYANFDLDAEAPGGG